MNRKAKFLTNSNIVAARESWKDVLVKSLLKHGIPERFIKRYVGIISLSNQVDHLNMQFMGSLLSFIFINEENLDNVRHNIDEFVTNIMRRYKDVRRKDEIEYLKLVANSLRYVDTYSIMKAKSEQFNLEFDNDDLNFGSFANYDYDDEEW